MSIVITHASGKLGKDIIKVLLENGFKANEIIALVRDTERLAEFKSSGILIRKVNFENYESVKQGLVGSEKLLFISSGDIINREEHHPLIIKAAKELNYKYLVYTSLVRVTEDGSSPIAYFENCHIKTEQLIKESNIPYTILINGSYTDVVVDEFFDDKVFTRGFFLPAGDGTINMATRFDMAEATANLLLSSDLTQHYGQEYTFTTDVKTSYHDVARILSEVSGKSITYTNATIEDYKDYLASKGYSSDYIKFNSAIALAIKAGEFNTSKSDIERFLNRKPTTVKEFFTQFYNNYKLNH